MLRWRLFALSVVLGVAVCAVGCGGEPKRRFVPTGKSATAGKGSARATPHRSHEHAHGAHPHSIDAHHHHPHPHPHLAGADGHHHPH